MATNHSKKASVNLVFEGIIRDTTVLSLPLIRTGLGSINPSAASHPCESDIIGAYTVVKFYFGGVSAVC